jgi:hypothetical protein
MRSRRILPINESMKTARPSGQSGRISTAMKTPLCILSVVVLAVLLRPGIAAALTDENGEYTKLGVGNLECDLWTQARQIGDVDAVWWKTLILGWVEGFLSSYNFYGSGISNISKGSDRDDIAQWVDKYCLQHPRSNIAGAAEALVADFQRPHRDQLHGSSAEPR